MKVYNVCTRFALTVTVVLVLLMTGGCTKTTIYNFYGSGQDLAGLKNYKWGPSSNLIPVKDDSQVDKDVQLIADQELKLKGFNKSIEKSDFSISIGYDYDINASPSSDQIIMLTLNMRRNENKKLLWRGTAYGTINTDRASGELKKAVQDILSIFPNIYTEAPKDVQLSDLGFQHLQKGDYNEAERYLNQALSENPNNPYAILNLGAVYQNTGRVEEARKTYETLIILNPPDVAVVSNQSGAKGKSLVNIAKENLLKLK